MVAVTSCCSVTLLACAAQHRSVGSLSTIVASYEWAAGRRDTHARQRVVGSSGTVAVCGVWATGQRCTVAALQPPLSTRLAGAWCLLVVRRLRRCAHSPKRDHDGHAQGIFVTLIVHRPSGLQGTRGGPGPAPGRAAGARAAGHVAAPELPRAGQRELKPQDTWQPRSCPGLGSGSWSRMARGGPDAHLSREARSGATACVATRIYTSCSLA
jgi:hypothetical protein